MASDDVEVIRAAHAAGARALAGGDVEAFVHSTYHPEVRYDPVEEDLVLHGHDEVAAYFHRWLEVWEEFEQDLEDVLDAGEHVLSVVMMRGRAKGSGMRITQRAYYLTEVRDGRVANVEEYLDRDAAFAAAGLSP